MLYRIKFISDEVDGFLREIKIDSDANFLDLCKAVLQSCGYPDDQMTEFYVCDEEWERHEQITREDVFDEDMSEDVYLMEDTPLSDFIEDEGQHFEFVFDPYAERSFFLDVKEFIEDPFVDKITKGDAKPGVASMEDDYDLYGDGEDLYNDDEIDFEGFEISDDSAY